MNDKEYNEFLEWIKKRYPVWKPNRASIELWEEWEEGVIEGDEECQLISWL